MFVISSTLSCTQIIFSEGVYSKKNDVSLKEEGSTLKGKNLLPMGANSFLLE